jgi:hypothetical protein
MISKTLFVETIEAIMLQMLKDKTIGEFFIVPEGGTCAYNNSELIKILVKHLQVFFPKNKDGFCEIEHYLFNLEFGKDGRGNLLEPSKFYDELVSNVKK